jgi:hypothetical protein
MPSGWSAVLLTGLAYAGSTRATPHSRLPVCLYLTACTSSAQIRSRYLAYFSIHARMYSIFSM